MYYVRNYINDSRRFGTVVRREEVQQLGGVRVRFEIRNFMAFERTKKKKKEENGG